jgi:hypothetical protein
MTAHAADGTMPARVAGESAPGSAPPVGLEPTTDRLETVHDQQLDCMTMFPSEIAFPGP